MNAKRVLPAALLGVGLLATAHYRLVQAANRSPWTVDINENGGRAGRGLAKAWFEQDVSYYERQCRESAWEGALTRKVGPVRDGSSGHWIMLGAFTCRPPR